MKVNKKNREEFIFDTIHKKKKKKMTLRLKLLCLKVTIT